MKAKLSKSDAAFHQRFKNAMEWLKKNMVDKGYDQAYVNGTVVHTYKKWDHIYHKCLDKLTRTKAMTIEKNAVRKEAEVVYAEMVRMIKANLATTDAERIELEIQPNARGAHQPTPVTRDAPCVTVDNSKHEELTFWWREEGSKFPNKPVRVHHIRVKYAILPEPPISRAQLIDEFIDTKNPHTLNVTGAGKGDVIYFEACWVSETGEESSWTGMMAVVIS
jgi:hypothetical protein